MIPQKMFMVVAQRMEKSGQRWTLWPSQRYRVTGEEDAKGVMMASKEGR